MMYKYLLFIACLGSSVATLAQSVPNYSKVQLTLDDQLSIQALTQAGIDIDHVHTNGHNTVDFILEEKEVEELKALGIPFEILIPDMRTYYAQILKPDDQSLLNMDCGLIHFDEGEMGGYHSYDDMVTHIEQMQQEFPEVVKITPIGNSLEDRTVYSVKISDNVNQDESNEEGVVYYDAITHAREPMGLETHLYYMWWLLENYGTDPEATYLVDHREMYFVPVVNPDGYVYNQSIEPNGGGLWRKNRRDNGNGCFGIDLNRNYSYEWGNLVGASDNPCSGRYHGTTAFSEPETQNVRDFVAQIDPAIAFSCHTYSDVFLCPNAFNNELPDYEIYADFSSEFVPREYGGYGTWDMMIGYFGAGTTQDFLHYNGTIAWTPEIGHDFWESPTVICDRVQEMFPAMKYISWVSGDYVAFQDYTVEAGAQLWEGSELDLIVRVRNKGLRTTAQNVKITATSPLTSLQAIQAESTIGSIAPKSIGQNDQEPLRFILQDNFTAGQEIPIDLTIIQDGMVSATRRILLYAGRREVLFTEDGETSFDQWANSGSAWGRTEMDAYGGRFCITDSNLDNYPANFQPIIRTKEPIDLSNVENPFLEFKAKWSLGPENDLVRLEVSSNNGTNWTSLVGKYTVELDDGSPVYSYNQHWIAERIDLKEFVGEQLLLRFVLETSSSVESDGFYFDDLQIVDYQDGFNVGIKNPTFAIESLLAFPNPNTGNTTLQLESKGSEAALLTISDLSGKVLVKQAWDLKNGRNEYPVTLENSGVYLIKVAHAQGTELLKVLRY